MNLTQARRELKKLSEATAPDVPTMPKWLTDLETWLLQASVDEKIAWLNSEIENSSQELTISFLTEWRDFLLWKADNRPDLQVWDGNKPRYPDKEYRHREIMDRHPCWGGWTGAGLPAELRTSGQGTHPRNGGSIYKFKFRQENKP